MIDHRKGDILPIEIMCRKEHWDQGVSLYMRQVIIGGETLAAQPVMFSPQAPGVMPQPMLELSIHQAQQFMDQLWDCGLRPSEGSGSAGAFEAQRRHLEDMRTLVFDPKA